MMSPICGEWIVLKREGKTDYLSPCWGEPEHEGPHVMWMPPEDES